MPGEQLDFDLSAGLVRGHSSSIFKGKFFFEELKDSVYLIDYTTDIKVYSSRTTIYARIPDFFPLYIESKYKKMKKEYTGWQYYYPNENKAIFFSKPESGKKDSTIINAKYSLQDITTLPYMVRMKKIKLGDEWRISLLQGDYVLKVVGKEKNKKYKGIVKSDSLWKIRSENGKIEILVSDDEYQYPVFIKTKNSAMSSSVLKLKKVSMDKSFITQTIGGENGKGSQEDNQKENSGEKDNR